MAKTAYCWLFILILLWGCHSRLSDDSVSTTAPDIAGVEVPDLGSNQGPIAVPDNADIVAEKESELTKIYLSQLHVREKTGNNDGPEVEMYLQSCGLGPGYPWCSAFVHWCLDRASIKNAVTAWSPTAENKAHLIFKLRKFDHDPVPGDVVTFYYSNLGRIGHTGFFHRKVSDVTYESVEGNTNGQGSREGNGVYKKFRSFNSTYSISRWERK